MNRIHEQLADLLEYPGSDWDANVAVCKELVFGSSLELLTSFTTFCDEAKELSLSSLQEIYTRTFDLNPVCTLDIGYHLFGENYKRGVFLANLRETEAPFDLGKEQQLPDYLPMLLRLVAKLRDEELRAALITECLMPALAKMLKAFGDGENPYRYLLETVHGWLHSELGDEFMSGSAAVQCGKALPYRQAVGDYFAAPPQLVQIERARTKAELPRLHEKVIVGGNV